MGHRTRAVPKDRGRRASRFESEARVARTRELPEGGRGVARRSVKRTAGRAAPEDLSSKGGSPRPPGPIVRGFIWRDVGAPMQVIR